MLRTFLQAFFLIGSIVVFATDGRSQTIDAGTWEKFLGARKLYMGECSRCHGIDGPAPLIEAVSFGLGDGLEAEFGLLLETIQTGIGNYMPAWEGLLSYDQQFWVLTYVLHLPADNVFRNKCASCHEDAAPRVPTIVPRGEALDTYVGRLHVNRGTEVVRTWDKEEQIAVIRMLRTLDEER